MILGWHWDGIGRAMGWHWESNGMAMGSQWDRNGMTVGLPNELRIQLPRVNANEMR